MRAKLLGNDARMTTALVAIAGAAGAVLRYRLGLAVGVKTFPWTTLVINLSGCFFLALLLSGPTTNRLSPATTTALAVGLLGAYTTFSTFGYETLTLIRTDRVGAASAYVLLSLAGGLATTALGFAAGRSLA